MEDPGSFWQELKRRRVTRVGLAYVVVGWAVIEGSDTITSILGLPEVTPRLVLALVALGFPVAIVLAWAFQVGPGGVRRAEPLASGRPSRLPVLGAIAVGLIALAGLAFAVLGPRSSGGADVSALDERSVAILPFRVSAPPELTYLSGGVMDLLAARLDGDVGPRSVDPGRVANLAQRDSSGAASVARAVGAGLVLTGSAVGDAASITLNAELARTSDLEIVAQASAGGPATDLTSLVDRLVAELLSLSAGEAPESVAELTSTSPQALVAYLKGREAWRDGEYHESANFFDDAIRIDSTFALAGLARADAGNMATWIGTGGGLELASRHRDRLGRRDLEYLETRLTGAPRTWLERKDAYRALTRSQPDRLEAWYFLGESLIHYRYDGAPDWAEQVRAAFGHALELDPDYTPALEHLLYLYDQYGTAAELRDAAARFLELTDVAQYEGLAAGTGQLTLDPARLSELSDANYIGFNAAMTYYWPDQTPPDFLPWVEASFAYARQRSGIEIPLSAALSTEFHTLLAMGRPHAAEAVAAERARSVGAYGPESTVELATWAGVEVGDVEAAVRTLATEPEPMTAPGSFANRLGTAEVWRFVRDAGYMGSDAADRIRGVAGGASHPTDLVMEGWALLLEAWGRVRAGEPVEPTLDALYAILRQGPGSGVGSRPYLLALSTLLEEAGDDARALSVLDRRDYWTSNLSPFEVEFWRREGDLASRLGEQDRARRAYERYLKLRAYAEPGLAPEIDRIRAALAGLGD